MEEVGRGLGGDVVTDEIAVGEGIGKEEEASEVGKGYWGREGP